MKAALLLQSASLLVMQPCERPPVQYQGDSVPARILFAPPEVVDAVCRRAGNASSPYQILACTNVANSTILMPDPCLYDDNYARLACHERSHLMRKDGSPGWSHG